VLTLAGCGLDGYLGGFEAAKTELRRNGPTNTTDPTKPNQPTQPTDPTHRLPPPPDGLDGALGRFPESLEALVMGGKYDEEGDVDAREQAVIRAILRQVGGGGR
jgi:hypothetical protein